MLFKRKNQTQFQDLVIGELKDRSLFRRQNGTYYATKVKKKTNGQVDLELSLPPTIQAKIAMAVKGGKQVRLFVPNDAL